MQILDNGEPGVTVRGKINDNFTELFNPGVDALVNTASMDLTKRKHSLASADATRTFTINDSAGDDITLVVTLGIVAAVYTFPVASLCVAEGIASGDNTLSLTGVIGDFIVISIKKVGNGYFVVSKNFGQ